VGFKPREEASAFVVPLSMLVVSQPPYRPKLCHYSFDRSLNQGYTNLQQQEICVILVVTIVGFVAILHALIVRLILSIKFKGANEAYKWKVVVNWARAKQSINEEYLKTVAAKNVLLPMLPPKLRISRNP
jgi:hypothetical protein